MRILKKHKASKVGKAMRQKPLRKELEKEGKETRKYFAEKLPKGAKKIAKKAGRARDIHSLPAMLRSGAI